MGLKVINSRGICEIYDVYEGLPPLLPLPYEVEIWTGECNGITFLDWPNANLHVKVRSRDHKNSTQYFEPVPGEVYAFPEGAYTISAYLDSSKLDGVTGGFTLNPSPAVLSLIGGAIHKMVPMVRTGIKFCDPGNYSKSQYRAVARYINQTNGTKGTSEEFQTRTGHPTIISESTGTGLIIEYVTNKVVLLNPTTTATEEINTGTVKIPELRCTVSCRNTTGSNQSTNIDAGVV